MPMAPNSLPSGGMGLQIGSGARSSGNPFGSPSLPMDQHHHLLSSSHGQRHHSGGSCAGLLHQQHPSSAAMFAQSLPTNLDAWTSSNPLRLRAEAGMAFVKQEQRRGSSGSLLPPAGRGDGGDMDLGVDGLLLGPFSDLRTGGSGSHSQHHGGDGSGGMFVGGGAAASSRRQDPLVFDPVSPPSHMLTDIGDTNTRQGLRMRSPGLQVSRLAGGGR